MGVLLIPILKGVHTLHTMRIVGLYVDLVSHKNSGHRQLVVYISPNCVLCECAGDIFLMKFTVIHF